MRKVVCNTTPILSLLKIGQLSLLEKLYTNVIIPEAVWKEVEAGKEGSYYADLTALSWIEIRGVQNPTAVQYLTDLDKGEAEVIVLAREINADLVIIDETTGRQYAQHFDLPLTGTLGILLRSKQSGYIPKIKPLLEQLRATGVWLHDRVIQDVLALAGEQ